MVISKASTTGLNHITNSQSGQDGSWEIITDASWLNQGGGIGTGFCNIYAYFKRKQLEQCIGSRERHIFSSKNRINYTSHHG